MPHDPATSIIILQKDGSGQAGPMQQAQTESYLANVLNDANRRANLKQALNDVSAGKGKPTGSYKYGGAPVWHASSDNTVQSVTLFYTATGPTASIFAMGEHMGGAGSAVKYSVCDYRQAGTDFALKKTIAI